MPGHDQKGTGKGLIGVLRREILLPSMTTTIYDPYPGYPAPRYSDPIVAVEGLPALKLADVAKLKDQYEIAVILYYLFVKPLIKLRDMRAGPGHDALRKGFRGPPISVRPDRCAPLNRKPEECVIRWRGNDIPIRGQRSSKTVNMSHYGMAKGFQRPVMGTLLTRSILTWDSV